MSLVDHHVHLYPAELNRDPEAWAAIYREPHWARLSLRRRRDGTPVQDFPDVAGLLRAMDAAGIARSILLGWYWENPETCAWHNRAMARWVGEHPDRLTGWATIQPASSPETVREELQRARDEGLSGLGELSPHSVGASCASSGLDAALGCAATWGWAVNLHVTDPRGQAFPGKIATPFDDFVQLARAWPTLRFVLAHWAGGHDIRSLRNVWVDTAAAPLIYGPAAWAMRPHRVLPEQICFGSDFPLRLNREQDAAAGWAAFASEARQNGLGEPALHSPFC